MLSMRYKSERSTQCTLGVAWNPPMEWVNHSKAYHKQFCMWRTRYDQVWTWSSDLSIVIANTNLIGDCNQDYIWFELAHLQEWILIRFLLGSLKIQYKSQIKYSIVNYVVACLANRISSKFLWKKLQRYHRFVWYLVFKQR